MALQNKPQRRTFSVVSTCPQRDRYSGKTISLLPSMQPLQQEKLALNQDESYKSKHFWLHKTSSKFYWINQAFINEKIQYSTFIIYMDILECECWLSRKGRTLSDDHHQLQCRIEQSLGLPVFSLAFKYHHIFPWLIHVEFEFN